MQNFKNHKNMDLEGFSKLYFLDHSEFIDMDIEK